MRYFLSYGVFILILILGFSYAGTVTLTGTCSKSLTSNIITFGLNNSGNEAAYSLQITPVISNANLKTNSYTIIALNPGSKYNVNVSLTNITANGTYVNYFKISYQQSNSTFDALFPCIDNFYTITNSTISLSKNVTENNNTYYINITATNNGNTNKTVNVSLILPQTFQYISKSYSVTKLTSGDTSVNTFKVKTQSGVGSYSGAIIASYVNNGLHYSTYQTLVLTQTQQNFSVSRIFSFNINPILIIIGIILVILLILIINAFLKSRRKY